MNWFEDEYFWRTFSAAMFPPERLLESEKQVEQILTLTNPVGPSVLDLCCGPGYHAVAFGKRGFTVTAVDLSPYLLEQGRVRASKFGIDIKWVLKDMRQFQAQGTFDLACNLTTSFGYFEEESENLLVLRNVLISLRPGGLFVIDTVGKELFARKAQTMFCSQYPDGSILLQRAQVLDDWYRIRNEWILINGDRCQSFTYEHSIYSGRELKELLLIAGFSRVKLFGDLAASPYGVDASRLIALATK